MNLMDYSYDLYTRSESFIMFPNGYGWNKQYLYRHGDSKYIYYKGDGIKYERYDISLIFKL